MAQMSWGDMQPRDKILAAELLERISGHARPLPDTGDSVEGHAELRSSFAVVAMLTSGSSATRCALVILRVCDTCVSSYSIVVCTLSTSRITQQLRCCCDADQWQLFDLCCALRLSACCFQAQLSVCSARCMHAIAGIAKAHG